MNSIRKYAPLLLALLLLSGCSRRDEALTLATPLGSVTGHFEGTLEEGLPTGEGVFTSENGWVYEGSFDAGSFGAGRVSDYPAPDFDGVYSGEVLGLIPQGEGELSFDNGSFSGSFEKGLPHTGRAENHVCFAELGEERLEGTYSGTMEAGLPQGDGLFTVSAAGRSLRYEGSFEAGRAAGEGSLSDDGFLLDGQRGLYEGSVTDGLPRGEGSFRARNGDNIDFSYNGEWKDGLFHGEGELLFDSALYYERRGRFSEGEFDPDAFELLAALGSREPCFTLSEAKKDYVAEYPELMDAGRVVPHYMEADYRFLRDPAFNYVNYVEDPSLYEESWMLFYNYIILQSRQVESFGDDNRCTVFLACNSIHREPAVFILFGDSSELLDLHYVTAYGIPLGMTHYTNANGEEVEAVVALLGSAGGY